MVGQEHVVRTLKNALKLGRLAHAFLFTGPRGVGKTSTARILARAVNCPKIDLNGEVEPCNVCPTCEALLEDRELDVIEMDAASRTGVEDVRDIIESARLAPVAGGKKIYIIDEVHMLSRNAFNAFLKTLEEPPPHVIFILATTDVHKVPPTIRSRVQRFDFRPLGPADIAPHLIKICKLEGFPYEEESLWTIARKADGSLRDAEGLLDQVVSFSNGSATVEETRDVLGVLPTDILAETTKLLSAQDLTRVPAFLEGIHERGVDYTEFLRALQSYWTDIVFVKEGVPLTGASAEEVERMKRVSGSLTAEELFRFIRLAERLEDSIKWSTAPRTRFEVAILRWAVLDRTSSIQSLIDELHRGPSAAAQRIELPPAEQKTQAAAPTPATLMRQPAAEPAEVRELAQEPTSSSSYQTVGELRNIWPRVVAELMKKSPALSTAQSEWEPVQLDGKKLTILCKNPTEFAQDRLKDSFGAVKAALRELTGKEFVLAAAKAPDSNGTHTAQPVDEPSPPTAAEGGQDELFSSFMDRVGGVEVNPKTVRQQK